MARPHESTKAKVFGFTISTVVKTVGLTLRMKVSDSGGIVASPPSEPLIWAFWHNRIFAMPVFYRRHLPGRRGAVLTSASKDGAVLASALRQFGVDAVRGSSSRRGARAMMEMVEWIEGGFDIVVTPDGPRGPKYQLQPGVVKLAQVTQAPIVPFLATYSRAVRLRSWDQFYLPIPFSKVNVTVRPPLRVPVTENDEAFEKQRSLVEQALGTE